MVRNLTFILNISILTIYKPFGIVLAIVKPYETYFLIIESYSMAIFTITLLVMVVVFLNSSFERANQS